MHLKWEATWAHGKQPNTFSMGQRVNSHFRKFIKDKSINNFMYRCLRKGIFESCNWYDEGIWKNNALSVWPSYLKQLISLNPIWNLPNKQLKTVTSIAFIRRNEIRITMRSSKPISRCRRRLGPLSLSGTETCSSGTCSTPSRKFFILLRVSALHTSLCLFRETKILAASLHYYLCPHCWGYNGKSHIVA